MNSLSQSTKALSSWRTQILRGACYLLFAFGILALGYAGIVFADSHIYQAVEIQKLERASPTPIPPILTDGDMLGELQVPRLGLNAIVVQGDSTADLRRAIGHLSNSALPGEWGNVALAGHRDTFFRPLRDIRLGDEIRFKTRERSFEYVVESIEVVAPTDTRVLEATAGHDLTLLTCFPFHYVGPAPKRFVVRAHEVDGTAGEQPAKNIGAKALGGQR
ncbi:MAG: class D sortase [Candidatus Acidiferrales bacterium]